MNIIEVGRRQLIEFFRKQLYLCKAEILSLRLNWVWSLIIIMVSPLSMLIFMYVLFGEDKAFLLYIVTGNMVMSMVTGTMLSLGQELGVLKQIKGFDYYAILPLRKFNIILAYILRATCTTLPSLFVLYFIGKYILCVNIMLHVSILVVTLLSGISLSSVGACIGIYSKNASNASLVTQVVQPLIVYLVPVYIELENMPIFLQVISKFIPTTYVAIALRSSCKGIWDIKSIIILIVFSIFSIMLIEKKMEWRQK